MSRVLMLQGRHDRAVDQAELAIAINPSSSMAHLCLAYALYWRGRADEAVPIIDSSIRLSPKGPYREFKLGSKALCFHALGQLEEAEVLARQVVHGDLVGPIGLMLHAAVLARLGRQEEAKAAVAELLESLPQFRLVRLERSWRNQHPEYRDQLVQDLRSAGLPE